MAGDAGHSGDCRLDDRGHHQQDGQDRHHRDRHQGVGYSRRDGHHRDGLRDRLTGCPRDELSRAAAELAFRMPKAGAREAAERACQTRIAVERVRVLRQGHEPQAALPERRADDHRQWGGHSR